MEHVYCRILPKAIRLISFYYTEKCTRPGAKMTWENWFDSNGQKKKYSRNRGTLGDFAHAFWNGVDVPVALHGEGPGWLESDKDLLLQKPFFQAFGFIPWILFAQWWRFFPLDVFWSVAICIVCERHIEMGLGESKRENTERPKIKRREKKKCKIGRGDRKSIKHKIRGTPGQGFFFPLDGWCLYKKEWSWCLWKPNSET